MNSVLALSLAPLGAGWAFGLPDREKPMSGFMTFGTNGHSDDELYRNAQTEIYSSIKFHGPAIVAITAPAGDARTAERLRDYQVVARTVVKALLPGVAKLVKVDDALECFTGSARFASNFQADKAAIAEAQRRGWLDDRVVTDRSMALAVWTYQAAQQLPGLAFNPRRKARL